MKTHRLKCWSSYFVHVLSGAKRFEIRLNDRGYQVGDVLVLEEFHPGGTSILDPGAGTPPCYSGRDYSVVVTYMTDYEQKPNYVVMSIEPCTVIVQTEAN